MMVSTSLSSTPIENQCENASLQESIDFLNEELNQSRELISDLEMRIEELQLDCELAEEKNRQLQEEAHELERMLDLVESERDALLVSSSPLSADDVTGRLAHENTLLKEALHVLQSEVESLRKSGEKHSGGNEQKKLSEASSNLELTVLKGQVERLKARCESQDRRIEELTEKKRDLEDTVSDLEAFRQVSLELEEQYQTELSDVRAELEELEADRAEMEYEIQQLIIMLKDREDTVVKFREKVGQLTKELLAMERQKVSEADMISDLKKSNAHLMQANREFKDHIRKQKSAEVDRQFFNIQEEAYRTLLNYQRELLPTQTRHILDTVHSVIVARSVIAKTDMVLQTIADELRETVEMIETADVQSTQEVESYQQRLEFCTHFSFFMNVCAFSIRRTLETARTEERLHMLGRFTSSLSRAEQQVDNIIHRLKSDAMNESSAISSLSPLVASVGHVSHALHTEVSSESVSWDTFVHLIRVKSDFLDIACRNSGNIAEYVKECAELCSEETQSEHLRTVNIVLDAIVTQLKKVRSHLGTFLEGQALQRHTIIQRNVVNAAEEIMIHFLLLFSALRERANRAKQICFDVTLGVDKSHALERLFELLDTVLDTEYLVRNALLTEREGDTGDAPVRDFYNPTMGLGALYDLNNNIRVEKVQARIQLALEVGQKKQNMKEETRTPLYELQKLDKAVADLLAMVDATDTGNDAVTTSDNISTRQDQILRKMIGDAKVLYANSERMKADLSKAQQQIQSSKDTIATLQKQLHTAQMASEAMRDNVVLLDERDRELRTLKRKATEQEQKLKREIDALRLQLQLQEARLKKLEQEARRSASKGDDKGKSAKSSPGKSGSSSNRSQRKHEAPAFDTAEFSMRHETMYPELRSLKSAVHALSTWHAREKGRQQVQILRDINRVTSCGDSMHSVANRYIAHMKSYTAKMKSIGACSRLVDLTRTDTVSQWAFLCRATNERHELKLSLRKALVLSLQDYGRITMSSDDSV